MVTGFAEFLKCLNFLFVTEAQTIISLISGHRKRKKRITQWVDCVLSWFNKTLCEDKDSMLLGAQAKLPTRRTTIIMELEKWFHNMIITKYRRVRSRDKRDTTSPAQDWKLVSRRQSGNISRDWRGTSTPVTYVTICGKRFRTSQVTKAGAPLPNELNTSCSLLSRREEQMSSDVSIHTRNLRNCKNSA